MDTTNRNAILIIAILVFVGLIAIYIALTSDSGDQTARTTPTQAEQTTAAQTEPEAAAQTEATTKPLSFGAEVKLTDNYAYRLPEDAEEIPTTSEDGGFENEKYYAFNDDRMVLRSFIITDEPDCFPDLVIYLYEENGTPIHYNMFFDTAVATAEDAFDDGEGYTLYRKAYFWPDGGSTLCCLSVTSYEESDLDIAGRILSNVSYQGNTGGTTYNGSVYGSAEDYLTPSQEELGEAIMKEVRENAWKEQIETEYNDYDTSLRRGGWR